MLWFGPDIAPGLAYEGNPTQVVIDLAQTQGAFVLGGFDSALYIQRVTLINPLVASAIDTNSGFGRAKTALPLWAIQFMRWGKG